ncbi:hypothetical protein C479_05168 [Halovivax asiaticus JCM 14624]|uniref:DNA recombination and repair protein Rad51-like C-terminal domain-containing protein n=1 Tax=Halovivax asiaticus JCM 14624 TaxID=1227490 RepID=M0BMQ2_9EURY|nr:hypothetical protein [Halovivax asiaticus]ELZ12171.1 hypothetical protein C479_05168 [Halovivax asiaticus JCM 14624]
MHHVEFDTGLTVLRVTSPRSTVVPDLVCTRLVDESGPIHWVDARNTASTHVLYDRAPSATTLAPLRIARAFTAYQHHSLIQALARQASARSSMLVAPNVDSLYHDDDLDEWERERLLAASLSTLRELGHSLDVPVLATTTGDTVSPRVDEYADHTLESVTTRVGTRLNGDGVESVGYWDHHGWQTTIPYWADRYGTTDALDPATAVHDRGLLAPDLTRKWEPPTTDRESGPLTRSTPTIDGGEA